MVSISSMLPDMVLTAGSLIICFLGMALMGGGFTALTISVVLWLAFAATTLRDRLQSLRRDMQCASLMENRTNACNTHGRSRNRKPHGKGLAEQGECSEARDYGLNGVGTRAVRPCGRAGREVRPGRD